MRKVGADTLLSVCDWEAEKLCCDHGIEYKVTTGYASPSRVAGISDRAFVSVLLGSDLVTNAYAD